MTALGHVEPGGPPLRTPLSPDVDLVKVSVGPMDNNAYLLRAAGGAELLIDAAEEPDRIAALAGRPEVILTTHRHGDHLQALPELAARWGSRLLAGTPDTAAIAAAAGLDGDAIGGVWDGDLIVVGTARFEVIGLVGHTPGSVTVVYRSPAGPVHLFTGDSLFPGGPGKTGSAADFTSLMDDLESKIFAVFDDDTVVHPGHGDDTTLGAERPQVPVWRSRGW